MHPVHQIKTIATDQRGPKDQSVQQVRIDKNSTKINIKCYTSGAMNTAVKEMV